jgi:rubrerythrin
MFTDTISSPVSNTLTLKSDSDATDDRLHFLNVYLEFVYFWIQTDIESYQAAITSIPGNEEKELLSAIAERKKTRLQALIALYGENREALYESMVDTDGHSHSNNGNSNQDCQPIETMVDALHFSYSKEFQSLTVFEKVSRSNIEPAIKSLLEDAAEHQRQHIMFLDEKLPSSNKRTGFMQARIPEGIF